MINLKGKTLKDHVKTIYQIVNWTFNNSSFKVTSLNYELFFCRREIFKDFY